jgi:hypothetical protein
VVAEYVGKEGMLPLLPVDAVAKTEGVVGAGCAGVEDMSAEGPEWAGPTAMELLKMSPCWGKDIVELGMVVRQV